jgi:hypothetical protein
MKKTALFLILSVSFWNAAPLLAESFNSNVSGDAAAFQDPFAVGQASSNSNNPASMSSGNSISQGITKETVQGADQVKENMQNDSRGREYKAEDARNQGNTGAAIAGITGAALAARAVPLLLSPFPWDKVAGADLMAKAGLEFAQAAADKSSAGKNDDQNKLLRQNYDEGAGAITGGGGSGSSSKPSFNSPELNNFLAERGINPDEFNAALNSGVLTNSGDIMKALGQDTSEISEEDMARANGLSADAMNGVFAGIASSTGMKESLSGVTLSMNEKNNGGPGGSSNGDSSSGGSGETSSSDGGVGASGMSTSSSDSGANGTANGSGGGASSTSRNGETVAVNPSGEAGIMSAASDFFGGLLAGHSRAPASVASKSKGYFPSEAQLRGLGITKKGRGNIFQIASTNYRSFGRWRASPRKIANR